MPLSTAYKEYILEKLHKVYLLDGVIPTSDQLEADLLEYQKTHPDLSFPQSKYLDFNVERGISSSALQIQTIAQAVSDDISVVTREIYNLAIQSMAYYERWSYQAKALVSKAKKLEQRVDSLLLMKDKTAGFFAAVGDVFADMNLVDTDYTTVRINTDEQSVTLNPGSLQAATVKQIDTTWMTPQDVSFYPLAGNIGTSTVDITSLDKVFKTDLTTWVGQIFSTKKSGMTAELKAHVSLNSDIEVSKISMEYTGELQSQANITAMYSVDGYTWFIVPCFDGTKPMSDRMIWSFPLTNMRWIKFLFYKPSSDSANNYKYSIRSIRLYGNVYSQDAGNEFYSKSLQATTPKGDPVEFSSVRLDACEQLVTNTNIKYFVSASKDNSSWTSWTDISPSSRDSVNYPKIISFGGTTWYDNLNSRPAVLAKFDKSTSSYQSITSVFDLSAEYLNPNIYHRFKNNSFGVVNTAIPVASGKDPDVVGNSIVVWRNTRPDTSSGLDAYMSGGQYYSKTVRGTPRGWGSDGLVYTCYFEILNPDGKIIDFGSTVCSIDGQLVTGATKISAGTHKFLSESKYWFDIAPLAPSILSSETSLKAIDPLYPYNHKLLIEGYRYSSSFEGERVYSGTDNSAEFYATRTSLFAIENNTKDYSYFAVKGVGSYEYESTTFATVAVAVEFDASNSDYTNELFLVKWRGGDITNNYKYVKLKAELETNDEGLTPVLTSYRLKLGI
jgi:hypothetical protein